jgi:ubiquinone/menaquinone biosynthesis C-methylase UbiE
MKFKDLFSKQAEQYAKYRPQYPAELYKFLSSLVASHERAWDCATGNGQAAVHLAEYFDEVIATDASAEQIKHAMPHPKVHYYTAPAENSGVENNSCDLITVATAIHWLDLDAFYKEVKRVAKQNAVIAAWVYSGHMIEPGIDKFLEEFFNRDVAPHWDPGIQKAIDFEEAIYFPFERIQTPQFNIEYSWTAGNFLNYLLTWSSIQTAMKASGKNIIENIEADLKQLWGEDKRKITWKLSIKTGRVSP